MTKFLQLLAAAGSLACVGAVGFWGVQLATLDTSEIPVIKKAEGPARVAPLDHGGKRADHLGYAVNSIQADGNATKPSERVVLAPRAVGLTTEDVAGLRAEPAVLTVDAEITKPQPRPDEVATEVALKVEEAIEQEITKPQARPAEFLLKPRRRPGVQAQAQQVASIAPKPKPKPQKPYLTEVPLGTNMVQLGAYDTSDIAVEEWATMMKSHGDLLGNKKLLVQKVERSGRVFYRMRAVGFETADAAKNMCSALEARKQACLPVSTR